jgi:hypothetical protein
VHHRGAVRIDLNPLDHHPGAAPTTTSYRSFTPVALHDRLPRHSRDHEGLRAPFVRSHHTRA